MTFSFKGPTPGLACAWTIHFKRCQCEDFGSHTVLWLISHFYFLLYDVFAIRLLSVIFYFPILFRTCMKLFNLQLFSEKGEAGGRAKSKERTLVLMFKQPRTCSQLASVFWHDDESYSRAFVGLCFRVSFSKGNVLGNQVQPVIRQTVFWYETRFFYSKSDKWKTIV